MNTSSSRRFDGERKNAYRRSYSRSRSFSPRNRLVSNDDNSTSVKKQRCRDFDEQGFCTQAEMCPYDHGEVVIAPLMSSGNTGGQPSSMLPKSANSMDQQDSNQLGIASNNNNNNNNFSMNNQMYNPNSTDMYQMPRHQRNNQPRRNNNGQQMKPAGPGLLPMPNNFNGQQPPGRFSNQRNNPINNSNGNGFNNPNQNINNVQPAPQANMIGNNANSNDLFNLPLQQRQVISNRPRNLVNIPTSIHQDDQQQSNDQILNMQSAGYTNNNQQRGIKRSYYNNNNNNNNFNNNNNVNNQPGFGQDQSSFGYQPQHNPAFNNQQQQQMPALLPTPSPLPLQQQQQQPIAQQNNQPLQANMNKPHAGFNQGGGGGGGNNNQSTTIILRRVPIDLNRVDKMRQHFIKFGQIVDIKCQYENNSDATLIQFATNQQAFAAYKCPQSVFNNRFIRICWLSNHQKQQQHQQHQHSLQPQVNQTVLNTDEPQVKRSIKDRLCFNNNFDEPTDKDVHSLNEIKNKENKLIKNPSVVMNPNTGSLAKTVYNNNETGEDQSAEMNKTSKESATTAAPNSQNLSNNFSSLNINKSIDPNGKKINYENAAKAIQDENQKKVLMLKLEVKQKARELIEKQIKDQKLLLQKFEQAKTVEEKTQILELVKQLSQSIEKEKEILNNKSFETPTTPPFNSSPFTFQKMASQKNMIIPPPAHHLKLNNKRLNNTNFLKSQANHSMKAAALAAAAAAAVTAKPATAAAATVQSQILAAQFSYSKIDNRPRNLLFTGVENLQEKTNLVNFIKMIGCQVETVNDLNSESNGPLAFSILFAARKDAEIALAKCSASLSGKLISITWGKAELTEQKSKEKENTATSDTESAGKPIESKALLSADEYDDDSNSKSKDKPLDANESTNESEQPTELEQKEFVDALFDDSTNYENLLS